MSVARGKQLRSWAKRLAEGRSTAGAGPHPADPRTASAVEMVVYALDPIAMIIAVRERHLPEGVKWPLRQLATFSFDVDEVACLGDERFSECCAAIRELVRRGNALLPELAALAGGSA